MSETYTHLLIPTSKICRPTAKSVSLFMEQIILTGSIGQDNHISFAKVAKVEPRFQEARNPFTGEILKMTVPSRRTEKAQRLSAASQIVVIAEQEQEYDVSITSELLPANRCLDVGVSNGGTWRPWKTEPFHLDIRCRVRGSVVRLCQFQPGDHPNAPFSDSAKMMDFTPRFDEDCTEDEQDRGLFIHPEAPNGIHIPKAGCGRFWVEFEYGNWVYPRMKNDSVAPLDPSVTRLAAEIFGTSFVEACSWG